MTTMTTTTEYIVRLQHDAAGPFYEVVHADTREHVKSYAGPHGLVQAAAHAWRLNRGDTE